MTAAPRGSLWALGSELRRAHTARRIRLSRPPRPSARRGRYQASMDLGPLPPLTLILRGLALSATGIRTVSTPVS